MIDRISAFLVLGVVLGAPFGVAVLLNTHVLLDFVFFYPLFMSALWVTGGAWFWWHWERHRAWGPEAYAPRLRNMPLVSIIIPCYNEQDGIVATIAAALGQNYPNIEIIAVNDGSSDETGSMLDMLAEDQTYLRVVHLAENQGKAMALRIGTLAARSEYLICIDGGAMLDADAASYLVAPMLKDPRVGAVSGNPRVRTRSTLVGQLQVGEFSSIIGLIQRTQCAYGRAFTVSGRIAAFRRRALDDAGYWDVDAIAEDIDVSWNMQLTDWSISYEPRALCWILMPETLKALWRQRLRWAQGGTEVFLKNLRSIGDLRHRRLWPPIIEYCLSASWAFALATSIFLWLLGRVLPLPAGIHIQTLAPSSFIGLLLAMGCLLQFVVSIGVDRRYELDLARSLYWVIWYPLVYWLIRLCTTLVSLPWVMLSSPRQSAGSIKRGRGRKSSEAP